MGLDDTVNLERLATAMDQIATALTALVMIEKDRFSRQYPPKVEKRAAEITRPDSEKRELYSDKPTKEWLEETESALPSRFQQRADQQSAEGAKGKPAPKVRGPAPVH